MTAPYVSIQTKAPVLHGWLVPAILVWLMRRIPSLSRLVWRNAGMFALRDVPINEEATHLPLEPVSTKLVEIAKTRPVAISHFPKRKPNLGETTQQGSATTFRHKSIRDYNESYKSKKTTPEKAMQELLKLIDLSNSSNAPLRAFSHVDRKRVLDQAQASTTRWNAGKPLSILDGIPIGVKDELDVEGYATYLGTTFFGNGKVATRDAFCVAKLRELGAIIVGKTGMAEIGTETINCNPNPGFGTVRNPYNPKYHTGGSSGGSAAAVASGLVPVAIGADGGGSVRIPASFCGIWGLKPTWGRVSGSPSPNLDPSTGHIGPLASNLEDLAIMYSVMSGPDSESPYTLFQPAPSIPKYMDDVDIRGLRVGYFPDYFSDAQSEVVKECQHALQYLVQRGATLVDIQIPDLILHRTAHTITIISEIFSLMQVRHPNDCDKLSYPNLFYYVGQKNITTLDYLTAQRMRTRAMAVLRSIFKKVDIIALPSTGIVAPKINPASLAYGISDAATTVQVLKFAFLTNFTGNPAMSCPIGYTPDEAKLPIGFQVIGNWWDEDTVFQVARALEQWKDRPTKRPAVFYDVLNAA